MKRLMTAIVGATLTAATLGAPLVSAGAAPVDFARRDTDLCAAGFGYVATGPSDALASGAVAPTPSAAKSEIGQTDGLEQTIPYMVRNIRLGGGSDPMDITAMGSTAFFSAIGLGGRELWKSDGTEGGTKRVKDINPGGASSNPFPSTVVGSLVFFSADDGTHGRELFVSDGTGAGTHLVKDINFAGSSFPDELANVNGTLYFSAVAAGGRELYKSDGSATGTTRVKDVRLGPKSSNPTEITAVGSVAYFAAFNKATGFRQIWRTDGTAPGTYALDQFDSYGRARHLARVGSNLYFLGDTTSGCAGGTFLYRTDGTNEGTTIVSYVNDDEALLTASFKNRLFLSEYGTLSKTNLAGDNLIQVKDFDDPTLDDRATIVDMHRIGTKLYLMVNISIYDGSLYSLVERQLWTSDGTSSGTVMIAGWGPMYVDPLMTSIAGELFFWSVGPNGHEIWSSDGSGAGTTRVAELGDDYPNDLVVVSDSLYFGHDDGVHGRELWRLVP